MSVLNCSVRRESDEGYSSELSSVVRWQGRPVVRGVSLLQNIIERCGYQKSLNVNPHIPSQNGSPIDFVKSLDKYDFNTYLTAHPQTHRVLLLDDAAYSGSQMSINLSQSVDEFENNHIHDYTFYVAVPFMTEFGKARIKQMCDVSRPDFLQIASHATMKTIAEVIPEAFQGTLTRMYDLDQEDLTTRTLTYFDHKVADSLSTLAVFRNGHVHDLEGKVLTRPTSHGTEPIQILFIPKITPPYNREEHQEGSMRNYSDYLAATAL